MRADWTIDGAGLFVATSPGTFNVIAADSGLLATATVTVVEDAAVTPYQTWCQAQFSDTELLDPLISGDSADPDGDGLANLLEYAGGFEPKNAGSVALPACATAAGYLTVTYQQSKTATDVTLDVEASDDLVNWSSAGLIETSRIDRGTYWEVTVQDAIPLTAANYRFMHVRVTRP